MHRSHSCGFKNLHRRKIYTVLIQYVQYKLPMKGSFNAKSLLGVVPLMHECESLPAGPVLQAYCLILHSAGLTSPSAHP
jgi:hypothetical protein